MSAEWLRRVSCSSDLPSCLPARYTGSPTPLFLFLSIGIQSFDACSNLPASLISFLKQFFTFDIGVFHKDLVSVDGTRKWLTALNSGAMVESVLIPEAKRNTLCISSQAGCSLSCTFCHTGTQKPVKNLQAYEIVAQYFMAAKQHQEISSQKGNQNGHISNVVFMGQGEPFYNWR